MKVLTGRDQRVLRLLQQLKGQRNHLYGVLDTVESFAANALRRGKGNRTELVGALTAILRAARGCCSKMGEEAMRTEMAFSRLGLPINAVLPVTSRRLTGRRRMARATNMPQSGRLDSQSGERSTRNFFPHMSTRAAPALRHGASAPRRSP